MKNDIFFLRPNIEDCIKELEYLSNKYKNN